MESQCGVVVWTPEGTGAASGIRASFQIFFRRFELLFAHGSVLRHKSVIVPNLGGFAGVSFKFRSAKVSLGYRGDFFFGAMDAGNDTRKIKNVGFYGPFATISVGIRG